MKASQLYAVETQLLEPMYEYQRKNGIKGQCLANTQYLFDSIKASFRNAPVKAKAVIINDYDEKTIYKDNEKDHIEITHRLVVHMVLQINEKQSLDPSAEFADLKKIQYIGHNFCSSLKKLKESGFSDEILKTTLKKYLLFISYAERMNSGELIVADKSYYNEQAEYVEAKNAAFVGRLN
jgi:hypothetical protein